MTSADDELDALINRLFPDAGPAFAVVGPGPAAFPASWRTTPLSAATPIVERLRMLEQELLGHLELLAAQVDEFDTTRDRDRLESEGIAVLIALRELRRHFPELQS